MLSKILHAGTDSGVRLFVYRQPGGAPAGPQPVEGVADRRLADLERATSERVEAARRDAVAQAAGSARAEAQTAVREELERLAQSVTELAALRPRLRHEAEADLVRLAAAIAGRILRREITLDPGSIAGLVKAALERLAEQEIARVRVSPGQEQAVRAGLASLAPAQRIEVVADATLLPGGVVFETERGKLDASIDAQLAEIEHGLTDRLRKSA